MLTLSPELAKDTRPGYRPYRAVVRGIRALSPHFVRVTFTGPDFSGFGTDGQDQRIKLVLPIDGRLAELGADDPPTIQAGTWYSRWRDLPDEVRNPFRTYTARSVRPHLRELDVDMVVHPVADGTIAPAAQWIQQATIGDEVIIVGPDARSIDSGMGIDWHPGDATELLLAGDETAAPAICSILESLPRGRRATAFIEVPDEADALPLALPAGARITWLPRGAEPVGALLEPAVRDWVAANPSVIRPAIARTAQQVDDVDVDIELLWDSPAEHAGGRFYAWLAGEAGVIKLLRRFLVSETGIDRRQVAFMGYWRLGKSEAQ